MPRKRAKTTEPAADPTTTAPSAAPAPSPTTSAAPTRKRVAIPGEGVAGDVAATWTPTAAVLAWDDNPRDNDRSVAKVAALIKAYGFGSPIVTRGSGVIIAGHTRLRAAQLLGMPAVPVRDMPHLSDEQAEQLALADNRAGEIATWKADGVAKLLARWDERSRSLVGWTARDTRKLLARARGNAHGPVLEDERVDATEAEQVTQDGDVWLLGDHRIVCCDSTKRAQVIAALDGERPELLWSDPPYGVALGKRGAVAEAHNAIRGDLTQAAIPLSFAVFVERIDADARIYLCGGSDNGGMYLQLWDHYLHAQPRMIQWVKDHFVLRRNGYHSRFETIYWGWKGAGGGADFWYGDRKQDDVWEVPRARVKDTAHPTEKPVELPARAIRNSCEPGGVVFDPFLGSGSALIAAEQLGRRCIGIDISRRWIDAVCERWERLTGGTRKHAGRLDLAALSTPSNAANDASEPEASTGIA